VAFSWSKPPSGANGKKINLFYHGMIRRANFFDATDIACAVEKEYW
jgi:hypothetical protein